MKLEISCDMKSRPNIKAKEGIDLNIETKSNHLIMLNVREHGIRLWVDGKEMKDIDFMIK